MNEPLTLKIKLIQLNNISFNLISLLIYFLQPRKHPFIFKCHHTPHFVLPKNILLPDQKYWQIFTDSCMLHKQCWRAQFIPRQDQPVQPTSQSPLLRTHPTLLKNWLQEQVPTIYDCHIKCRFVALMNKLTAIKRAQGSELALPVFNNIWGKFVTYWSKVTPTDDIIKSALEMGFKHCV